MVPTVNIIGPDHTTQVAVYNNSDQTRILPQQCLVGSSNREHQHQLNTIPDMATSLEISPWRSHPLSQAPELNTISQAHPTDAKQDMDSHHKKLATESAILSHDPIPDEFNIHKRKPTITDAELLDQFQLSHLNQQDQARVKALILKHRPIWSEHAFDLGLHKYIKHNIVLTADLPPCLLYTSPSPRDLSTSRMPSSA